MRRRQLPLPWPTEADAVATGALPDGTPASIAHVDPRPSASATRIGAAPADRDQDEAITARLPLPVFVRNGRARRYILRVLPDARVRVTIPRYGSRREAEAFLRTRLGWIADRRRELAAARVDRRWQAATSVWWRGVREAVRVEVRSPARSSHVTVQCGDVVVHTTADEDYRGPLERGMRRIASTELPRQLMALAARHGLTVTRVTVRNQRSRWGSCSRDGRIALNWRLLQMPETVRENVLLHELMHLREHNHSPQFWALVEAVCPGHLDARRWLRHEGLALC